MVAWGEELMKLHIGYESVEPFELQHIDTSDEKAHAATLTPKALLRADKDATIITLDTEPCCEAFLWTYGTTNSAIVVHWNGYSTSTRKKIQRLHHPGEIRYCCFADYKEKVLICSRA
jgi:hypothetical protein